jgi:hypothetical protein
MCIRESRAFTEVKQYPLCSYMATQQVLSQEDDLSGQAELTSNATNGHQEHIEERICLEARASGIALLYTLLFHACPNGHTRSRWNYDTGQQGITTPTSNKMTKTPVRSQI